MKEHKNSIKNSEALLLLKKSGCDAKLIRHSIAVSKLASKTAKLLKTAGYDIDVNFVETAALLHDIGRSRTNGIMHGIEGAKILRSWGLVKHAKVCERHLGAGIAKEETKSMGLPKKDFIPKTLEEKIIAHSDNLISGSKEVPIKKTIAELKKELGENHPAILRIASLSEEISTLISKSKSK